jgi:hypothetical protein
MYIRLLPFYPSMSILKAEDPILYAQLLISHVKDLSSFADREAMVWHFL